MNDISQDYYWTEEWQEAEAEVEQEIEDGDVVVFKSLDDLLSWLEADE